MLPTAPPDENEVPDDVPAPNAAEKALENGLLEAVLRGPKSCEKSAENGSTDVLDIAIYAAAIGAPPTGDNAVMNV